MSGVNFAVAETGSLVLVTNEGNGRMVTSLPRVHVAVMGMERVVAAPGTQLDLLLQLLPRSATGQRLSSYTSIITGPRRAGEADGPDEVHLVILDNGRAELLGSEYHEMLACIRCGACLNVCPVYRQTGGHAYGWVYSGPMGAVLTPLLAAKYPEAAEVANASTLCGACMDACPVQIPLQDLLLGAAAPARQRRPAAPSGPGGGRGRRRGRRPPATARSTRAATWARGLGRHAKWLPGASRWTDGREAPAPALERFRDRWALRRWIGPCSSAGCATASPAACPRTSPTRCRPPAHVPEIVHLVLDRDDLVGTFERTATAADAIVHRVEGREVPGELVGAIVERHAVARAVATAEPEAAAVAATLADLGVTVSGPDRESAAGAQLGVTSAVSAIAATGSVVLDSGIARGRLAGLLPEVHLCVVPVDRLVATPSDVLRGLAALPSNLVLVSGPSRTGDIEQILTLGVHGPVALHVVLLGT